MALTYTSASSDRVVVAPSASINNLSTFTYVAWINPSALSASKPIIYKRTASSGVKQLSLIDLSGNLEARIRKTTSAVIYVTNDTPIVAVTWSFVAMTYDNSAAANSLAHIYHGTLTSAVVESTYASKSDGSGTLDNDNTESMYFGNVVAATQGFPGAIADVGVWNRVLSLAELRDLQFRFRPTSGCVVFQRLGYNGTGTQPDWSGNGNSGTVTGTTQSAHVPLGPMAFVDRPIETAASANAYTISGSVTVGETVSATKAYNRNASITGAITVAETISATKAYNRNASISGTITVGESIAASKAYNRNASISGSTTVSLAIAATSAYNRNASIAGSITVALSPAAALSHNVGPSITGAVLVSTTVSAQTAYTFTRDIAGSVTVSCLPGASLLYQTVVGWGVTRHNALTSTNPGNQCSGVTRSNQFVHADHQVSGE